MVGIATLKRANRVQESTATTGTGTITLAGASTQYQSFAAGVGSGNVTYTILSGNGTDWEVGNGVLSGSSLTRITGAVEESSNSGALINLSGTSTVFLGLASAYSTAGRTIKFNSTPIVSFGPSNFYPDVIPLPALVSGSRIRITAVIRRVSLSNIGVGLLNASGQGFAIFWQVDTNIVTYRMNIGSRSAIGAAGNTAAPYSDGPYLVHLEVTAFPSTGSCAGGGVDGLNSVKPAQDNTYNLTAGTWFACVCADNSSADVFSGATFLDAV